MRDDESEHIYNSGDFGNRISSYECGRNVRYEFHNHNNPSTGYEVVSGAGHVRSSRLEGWMEDRVTKVIMPIEGGHEKNQIISLSLMMVL